MMKADRKLVCAKDIAQAAQLSYAAINNYTDIGLLDVVAKKNRVRLYDREKTRERLALIAKLTNEGYTLRVIRKLLKTGLCLLLGLVLAAPSFAQDVVKIEEKQEAAGEFFGMPVSMDNYRFAKAAVIVFGSRWGAEPQTPQELEDRVWEDLLLSFEAFRRDVSVSPAEVDEEVSKLLAAEKVAFDWKKDRPAYEKWVQERVNEPAVLFENQLKHLIQLQRLREQVINSIEPEVSEKEAYQEYLNEYNTLSVELVQFDDLKKAEEFYKKMRDGRLWDKEAKKDPKFTVRPGFVSLECLIELWKIPKEDAYAMLDLKAGSVYKPTPIYRGYGVFHTLEKRAAEKEKFPELKDSYFDQIKRKKQYEGFNVWLKALKKNARTKVFTKPEKQ